MNEIIELKDEQQVNELFQMEKVLVFKNSTQCGISRRALSELRRFVSESTEALPVRIVDVIGSRTISRAIEERTGITHQSPQAILLREGKPVWNASHFDITVQSLQKAAAMSNGNPVEHDGKDIV